MTSNVRPLRPKAGGDTEKVTINLGYIDLGHIDLLVQDGFYSNRTDFIRTGLASIAADVSPELARATIGSVSVLGALQASAAVKVALADRSN